MMHHQKAPAAKTKQKQLTIGSTRAAANVAREIQVFLRGPVNRGVNQPQSPITLGLMLVR